MASNGETAVDKISLENARSKLNEILIFLSQQGGFSRFFLSHFLIFILIIIIVIIIIILAII
jgi:hypothetical protein